jgi:hypothetical protein
MSWEAKSSSASQEIPNILCKPKIHYRVHKSLPRVSCMYVRMYVCIYMCVYVCVYVCIVAEHFLLYCLLASLTSVTGGS